MHLPEIKKMEEGSDHTEVISSRQLCPTRGWGSRRCLSTARSNHCSLAPRCHAFYQPVPINSVVCVSEHWYIFYYRFIFNKTLWKSSMSPCWETISWETSTQLVCLWELREDTALSVQQPPGMCGAWWATAQTSGRIRLACRETLLNQKTTCCQEEVNTAGGRKCRNDTHSPALWKIVFQILKKKKKA